VVASVALADSINPSTLIPALWLARGRELNVLASYTVGVFAVYLAGGFVLLLGPGRVLIASLHHVHGPFEHGLQAAVGILALVFAFVSWRSRGASSEKPLGRHLRTPVSAFALGAAIMAVELPTAFMYFGAISAVLAARPPAVAGILLLIAYNLVFVAPLAALVAIRRYAGARTDRWLIAAQARVRYGGQVALAGVACIFGIVLTAVAVNGLLVT
jgi:cytochrome c biogenesis protein CcdA